MDSNFRCQSHLHNLIGGDSIQRKYRPDPDKYVLTAWRLHWKGESKPRISLVMFRNFDTNGFKIL